jgi:hypothetical protein
VANENNLGIAYNLSVYLLIILRILYNNSKKLN